MSATRSVIFRRLGHNTTKSFRYSSPRSDVRPTAVLCGTHVFSWLPSARPVVWSRWTTSNFIQSIFLSSFGLWTWFLITCTVCSPSLTCWIVVFVFCTCVRRLWDDVSADRPLSWICAMWRYVMGVLCMCYFLSTLFLFAVPSSYLVVSTALRGFPTAFNSFLIYLSIYLREKLFAVS